MFVSDLKMDEFTNLMLTFSKYPLTRSTEIVLSTLVTQAIQFKKFSTLSELGRKKTKVTGPTVVSNLLAKMMKKKDMIPLFRGPCIKLLWHFFVGFKIHANNFIDFFPQL